MPTPHQTETSTLLSVVVPTHGRTDLFLQTLASLEAQTLDAFEIIVTDDSPAWEDRRAIQEATAGYIARTGRAGRYLFSQPRLGQAKNTNQGLMAAEGRFVRILHSDDLLAPRALETEVGLLMDGRLNLEVLYHHVEAFCNAPKFDRQPSLMLVQPSLLFRSTMHSSTPLPSATVFRRELLAEVGGMREDFDFLCDWEFIARLITAQHRRHRFIGQVSRGLIGWRVHPNSTTGRLWHRHFLEHEQFMNELRDDAELSEALIGDQGHRDGFFASAVRYRYSRLVEDVAKMRTMQLVNAIPMIVRCALSKSSLKDRRTPAPWEPKGAKKYPNLVVACRVPALQAGPPPPSFAEPRKGVRFALSAHLSRIIIGWGKAFAASVVGANRRTVANPAPLTPAASSNGDARDRCVDELGPRMSPLGEKLEIHHKMGVARPAPDTIRIHTEYNNTINLWSLRDLIDQATQIKLNEINANAFVEVVLHQALKFVRVGSRVEASIIDNQHLTSFGLKALIDRLYPDQFGWSSQERHTPFSHTLRYERKRRAHRAYTAPHTGWTFGMLTTGQRLKNVEQFIDSVERYCEEPYEILLVSPVDLGEIADRRGVRMIRFNEHDDLGWITRKKNLICREASFSDILICHDRFVLDAEYTRDFRNWGYAYGLAAVRVRLADGRRGLDWAVVSSQNQVWSNGGLLDYRTYSQYVYNPGGATIVRKTFWRDFPWNENLFWNEHEDVELCRRIQRAGGVVALTAASVVAAEDRWLDHNPRIPFCDQNEVLIGQPVGEQRIRFISKEQAA
jgi:glycosyltransferase involved in cell wall biosynthesis